MNIHFFALDFLPGTMVLFYVLIFLFVAFLAICWIAFPFIVISKFNELLKVERQALKILQKQADHQNETNKALQYLVDSAGEPNRERV